MNHRNDARMLYSNHQAIARIRNGARALWILTAIGFLATLFSDESSEYLPFTFLILFLLVALISYYGGLCNLDISIGMGYAEIVYEPLFKHSRGKKILSVTAHDINYVKFYSLLFMNFMRIGYYDKYGRRHRKTIGLTCMNNRKRREMKHELHSICSRNHHSKEKTRETNANHSS